MMGSLFLVQFETKFKIDLKLNPIFNLWSMSHQEGTNFLVEIKTDLDTFLKLGQILNLEGKSHQKGFIIGMFFYSFKEGEVMGSRGARSHGPT